MKSCLIKYLISLITVLFLSPEYTCQNKSDSSDGLFLPSKIIKEIGGVIQGVIYDEKGIPKSDVNIIILESYRGTTSDKNGNFKIKEIEAGNYTIKFSHISFETKIEKINVQSNKITELSVYLKTNSFQIGGIDVIASQDLLPSEAASKTIIYIGEIEHFQASSVKDVLDLVPGIQKTDNPNLGKFSQAAIRADESDKLSAFGTLVLIDGMPISNNVNLQFERMQSSKTGLSNLGGGTDLRTIPADNIESIEAISGLPSVKFGDLTEGVINIKTRTHPQPMRLKFKNNPDTREFNFGGSSLEFAEGLNYNVNFAISERDIRVKGDEYYRLTGQVLFRNKLFSNQLNINQKINGQLIFDEEEPKGDVYKIKNYNRGFDISYSNWGNFYFEDNESNNFEFNGYLNLRKENSMKSRLVQSDLRILPNGDTISSYIGKVETKGSEWLAGINLIYNNTFLTSNFLHKFLTGIEVRYEANNGIGITFDTLFSYYGIQSGRRPYSFKDIPDQVLLNFYSEDNIAGKYPFDFYLSIGFRYEMYKPYAIDFSGLLGRKDFIKSHQGSFFNPRVSLLLPITNDNQFRVSFGSTSKSPAFNYLFPPEEILRWKNPITNQIVYLRFSRLAPNLKGYKEKQFEISFDQKISNLIGVTVTGYYKERRDEFEEQPVPVYLSSGYPGKEKIYYVDSYSVTRNLGWTISKGIELVTRTQRIDPLNISIQVIASYSLLNTSKNGFDFNPAPDISKGQLPNFKPDPNIDSLTGAFYPPKGNWNDKLQLNYFLRYTLPALGLWITLRAEQIVFERNQQYSLEPLDYNLLTLIEKEKYLFDRKIISKDPKWLFNLNISKSLWSGSEVSFYINNIFDDPAIWRYYSSPAIISEVKRNPPLFYGLEFSMIFEDLF